MKRIIPSRPARATKKRTCTTTRRPGIARSSSTRTAASAFHRFSGELSLNEAIAKLGNLKGDPYPHPVFAKEPFDPKLLEYFGAASAETGEAVTPVGEICYREKCGCGQAHVEPSGKELFGYEKSLEMPEDCMYGRMGEWAKSLKTPLGHAYPAMLAAFSYVPSVNSMCGCRLCIYCAIIAPVGGGKNTSIVRAIELLGLQKNTDWRVTTASSDRGLMDAIGSKTEGRGKDKKVVPGPRKLLLRTNEMGATLKKAAIDGSALSDMLCEIWDTGEWECRDKNGPSEADCCMSWIGGVPVDEDKPEQFAEAFGKFASRGLMSRMLLGYNGGARFQHDGEEWTPQGRNMPITSFEEGIGLPPLWTLVKSLSPEARIREREIALRQASKFRIAGQDELENPDRSSGARMLDGCWHMASRDSNP